MMSRAFLSLLLLVLVVAPACSSHDREMARHEQVRETYLWELDASSEDLDAIHYEMVNKPAGAERRSLELRVRSLRAKLAAERRAIDMGHFGDDPDGRFKAIRDELRGMRLTLATL